MDNKDWHEQVLKGAILKWTKIKDPNWETDHCTFCWNRVQNCFATEDGCFLICGRCYSEHKDKLGFCENKGD